MLLCGVVAPVVAWGLTIPAALTWPGYDPVVQSISVLVRGPNGWLLTLAFVVSGLLGGAWAVGMGRVMGASAADRRRVRALLLAQAVITLLFAVFPTDLVRGRTLVGVLHLVNFGLYAIAAPATLMVVARVMRRDERWAGWARPTAAAAGVLVLGVLLAPITLYGPLLPWLGFLERVFVAVPTGWQAAVAVAGLRWINRAGPAPR